MPKDPYEILGVPRTASDDDIKKAYRKLSKEWHPDKQKAKGSEAMKKAEEKYKEINQAYELLSDPKRRQMYDQFGHAGGKGGAGFGGFGFGGLDPSEFSSAFGGLEDILETFFGRGFAAQAGFEGGGRARDERGRDIEVSLTVPFTAVSRGGTEEVKLRTVVPCTSCHGKGSTDGELTTCADCEGRGVRLRTRHSFFGVVQQTSVCPTCRGSGRLPTHPCRSCHGEGRREEQRAIAVKIPPGVDEGTTLRLSGQGEAGRQGATPGDLYVHIRVVPDPRFEREGSDIRSRVRVGVGDAVLGTEVRVPTADGEVTLKIPAGTQPGQVIRLKGHGVPMLNSSRRGDHYVTVDVEIPTKFSRRERELWEELRKQG